MRPTAGADRTASRSAPGSKAAPRRRAPAPARHAGIASDRARRRGRIPERTFSSTPRQRGRRPSRRRSAVAARRARRARGPARRREPRLRVAAGSDASVCPDRQHATSGARLLARSRLKLRIGATNRSGAPSTRRSSPRSIALQRRREENGTCPVTPMSPRPSSSLASTIASSVGLRAGRGRIAGEGKGNRLLVHTRAGTTRPPAASARSTCRSCRYRGRRPKRATRSRSAAVRAHRVEPP